MTSHARPWKEQKLALVKKLAKEYPFIAVADLEGLPANILSVLRKRLHGEAEIIVAKTRVVQKGLKESGANVAKLDAPVSKSVAVIFSKKNPFDLWAFVKRNKGATAATEGDIADADIIVQAGDTGLPPGPALSTLKAAGLKVKVAGPTIAITDDAVVAKKGEPIKKEVADVLGKLNIKPIKVGMKIIGVLDKSTDEFYTANTLDVDEEELFNKFVLAYQQAFNLAVNAEYFTDKTTEAIIMKAAQGAKAIQTALGAAIDTPAAEAPAAAQ